MNPFLKQLDELAARAQNYRYHGANERLAELAQIIADVKAKNEEKK